MPTVLALYTFFLRPAFGLPTAIHYHTTGSRVSVSLHPVQRLRNAWAAPLLSSHCFSAQRHLLLHSQASSSRCLSFHPRSGRLGMEGTAIRRTEYGPP